MYFAMDSNRGDIGSRSDERLHVELSLSGGGVERGGEEPRLGACSHVLCYISTNYYT